MSKETTRLFAQALANQSATIDKALAFFHTEVRERRREREESYAKRLALLENALAPLAPLLSQWLTSLTADQAGEPGDSFATGPSEGMNARRTTDS